ncbi:hypothetical protein ACIQI7_07100 [Kitasatospora sp. NPDC092039]|uniref:hypothetical protein n=1 Tax=Kitasatospora sp. NPDC092039 TaxID=3364086 RepID=UPI0038100782
MNASVIARIAKIVPLAVVAAVGAAACGPTNGGASVAAPAPAPTPAATSSATPGAGSVPTSPVTTAPAAPTTEAAPSTAAPSTAAPTAAAPAAKTGAGPVAKSAAGPVAKTGAKPATDSTAKPGGIGITFNGLREGQRIQVGDTVSFSVTWRNDDASGSRAVAPVVATRQYEGAPCRLVLSTARGTLERKDASGWKTLPGLSQGGGMDYAGSGDDAAFTLAAGESRTVEYRMVLDVADRPGSLAVEADAPAPHDKSYRDMAKSVVTTKVVDAHRPVVDAVSEPSLLVYGGAPTEFSYTLSSPDGVTRMHPSVFLSARNSEGLSESDVTVQTKVGGEWKTLTTVQDCNGRVGVEPTGLADLLPGSSVRYTFRVAVARHAGPMAIEVGGVAAGHHGVDSLVQPYSQG